MEILKWINDSILSYYGSDVFRVVETEKGYRIQWHNYGHDWTFFTGFSGEECLSVEDILFRLFGLIWEDGRQNG